jgi:hypothetical protein
MMASVLELLIGEDASVECECRACEVRWVARLGWTVCWCCGQAAPLARRVVGEAVDRLERDALR